MKLRFTLWALSPFLLAYLLAGDGVRQIIRAVIEAHNAFLVWWN